MQDYEEKIKQYSSMQLQCEYNKVTKQKQIAMDYLHRELIDYCEDKIQCIKREFERRCKDIKFR